MIYLQPWWQLATKFKKKKIGVGYCNGQPWLWLAAEDMFVLSVSLWDIYSKCVFVYIMCMRPTIVYIYPCDCIGIFECEAHFNMIIVPASVWGGYKVMEGFTCFTVRRVVMVSFGEGIRDRWWPWRCFRVCGLCAVSLQARAWWEAGVGCYLMIWGQSLQALAFRLARASQAGSVDTCGESLEGKRFDTSLTEGGDGVESAISTETTNQGQNLVTNGLVTAFTGSFYERSLMKLI